MTNIAQAIEPSALDQIFEPLQRGAAPAQGQETGSGLGLGLFIVREIAKAHGGAVEVHCKQGETTFEVRLPRQPLATPMERGG